MIILIISTFLNKGNFFNINFASFFPVDFFIKFLQCSMILHSFFFPCFRPYPLLLLLSFSHLTTYTCTYLWYLSVVKEEQCFSSFFFMRLCVRTVTTKEKTIQEKITLQVYKSAVSVLSQPFFLVLFSAYTCFLFWIFVHFF